MYQLRLEFEPKSTKPSMSFELMCTSKHTFFVYSCQHANADPLQQQHDAQETCRDETSGKEASQLPLSAHQW